MKDLIVHENRRRGPIVVHTTKMFRGGGYIVSAWEPTAIFQATGGHSTITTFDAYPKTWWGRIGTRRLPKWIDKVPAKGLMLETRIRLVHRHYAQQMRVARLAIELSGAIAGMVGEWDGSEFRYAGDNGYQGGES